MTNNAPATWDVSQTITICDDGEEKKLPKGIEIMKKQTSVKDAIDELNEGKVVAKDGLCIVHSESHGKYFLIFREDKEKDAYDRSQMKPPLKTLIKLHTMGVVDKLPQPVREKLEQLSGVINVPVWNTALGVPCIPLAFLLCPSTVLIDVVGGAYPVWQTLKMIATLNTNITAQVQEREIWVIYWMLFALLKSNPLMDIILANLPTIGAFSNYLKLAFFVWLYLPQTNGAQTVLDQVKKHIIPKLQDLKKTS